jgi:hypothetical protein
MRVRLALALAFVLVLVGAAGCRSAPPEDGNAMVLRIYDVPKGTARPLLFSLKDALWLDDTKKNIGRSTLTPDGRIAVLAPANIQVGIEDLVHGLGKNPPPPEQTIDIHYFVLLGKPVASAAPPPPGVAEIQPAIDEIVRSQGQQAFTLAKRVSLAALSDEDGRLDGEELEIRQRCTQTGDDVFGMLEIRYGKTDKITTRVHFAKDRIIVLGATGQHGGEAADGSTLYYVARVAPHADGHAR